MSLIDRTWENPIVVWDDTTQQPPKNNFFNIKVIFIVLVFAVIIWRFLYSFYLSTTTLLIDNPTSEEVVFQIWDLPEDSLGAYESKTIDLKSWVYDLKVDWELVGTFEKKAKDTHAFLNPTNDMYLKEFMVYGSEAWYDALPENTVDLYYDDQVQWPFESYTWYYISWDWDYWFDREFPEEVSLWKYQSYTIKSKLYRYDDFVDMYNTHYAYDEEETTNETQQ